MIECWSYTQIVVAIIVSVAAVPMLMGLGVLTWMLWNMLHDKGGWK